jgi:nucleoside-diphosphate-sugar epimerase
MNFFKNKKIVVPGGEGFFGMHLVPKLKKLGAYVFVPKHNSPWDFRKSNHCKKLFEQNKFDLVINLAANQGGIGYHKGRQAELYHDNMLMGMHLLEEACVAKVPKFINVVAGCSYPGYLEKEELNEDDYWNGAVHESIFSYGLPRKISVSHGLALKKQYGFNSIHLIYANMYGPGEHFHPEQSKALAGMLLKFYQAKKENLPFVEIWGSGKPVRDQLYVKDGVEGLLKAAELYNEVEPLNIASGVGKSIAHLAETIKNIIGYKGKIFYNKNKPDGAMKKVFGIKNMRSKLNWQPSTPLKKGIKETLKWLKNNYDYAITH